MGNDNRVPGIFPALKAALRCANVKGKIAIVLGPDDWVSLQAAVNASVPFLNATRIEDLENLSKGVFTFNGIYFMNVDTLLPKVTNPLEEIARGR